MIASVFHIVQLSSGWQIKTAGPPSAFKSFGSAQEAVTAARSLAIAHPPSQIRVHSPTGKLLGEWTYDAEPVETPVGMVQAPALETQAVTSESAAQHLQD